MMPARSSAEASRAREISACEQTALRLYGVERWEAAAEALKRLLNLDPHRDGARIALGDCLLHLNRPEEALHCFDQCRSGMERAHSLFGTAAALQMLRRFDEAEAAYDELLALDPGSEEALSNLVALGMEVFDMTRVERYGQRLLEVSPDSPVGLQAMIVLAVTRGEFEAAAAQLRRLLEIVPREKIFFRGHPGTEPERLGREKDGPLVYHAGRANSELLAQVCQGLGAAGPQAVPGR